MNDCLVGNFVAYIVNPDGASHFLADERSRSGIVVFNPQVGRQQTAPLEGFRAHLPSSSLMNSTIPSHTSHASELVRS